MFIFLKKKIEIIKIQIPNMTVFNTLINYKNGLI